MEEVKLIVDSVKNLGLKPELHSRAYSYKSLPLCVIDAVFSIGVRYSNVEKAIDFFSRSHKWQVSGRNRNLRSRGDFTIEEFISLLDSYKERGIDLASVFNNKQRTSARGGILKSDACLLFSIALFESGINDFADITDRRLQYAEDKIRKIPGQASGISFSYFRMLAGDDNLIKPDRMVIRYISRITGIQTQKISGDFATKLLQNTAEELKIENSLWSPLILDFQIWNFEQKRNIEAVEAKQSTGNASQSADEHQLRIDLAAALRLAARLGWTEAVANHFSAAVSDDGRKFLVNPRWVHFSNVKASDLVLCDADDPDTMKRPDAPDPSAWSIHSAIHRRCPHGRVAMHLHPVHATALAGLKDPSLKPIDQNTARFFNRISIDTEFGGIATAEEEGERIAAVVGSHSAVMMGNHGVTTLGATVAEAFDRMYHLERAARTLVIAYSTGQPLAVMSDELAEKTASDWDDYKGAEDAHFAEMKRILDREDPSYAD